MSPWIDLFYRLNPLIRREMRRMTRMGRTHILLLVLPTLLLLSLLDWPIAQFLNRHAEIPRLAVLNAFVLIAYYLATLVMPVLAISAVSLERESGSMDMLRSSGLGAGRILTGKTNGLLCVFGLMLLTGVPVVSVIMLFGGIDFQGLMTLFVISLAAAFRAAAIGFLAYGLVGNLFTATALAYAGALGWPWLVEEAAAMIPDLVAWRRFLEPAAAMQLLISPGEVPVIRMLGAERPFWWGTVAFLLFQSLGCLFLAGPLIILPPAGAVASWRPVVFGIRGRRFRERNLSPNNCNIIFERDFRSGLYMGSWGVWMLVTLVLAAVFSAAVRFIPVVMEGLRIAAGLPLFLMVAVQTATGINRMRRKDVLAPVLLTGILPRALLEAKAFYTLIMVAPFLLAVWIADCVNQFPGAEILIPVHSLNSAFMTVALGGRPEEILGRILAASCSYLTHFIYLFPIIAFGLRFSTQHNNSTTALLQTLGWSALYIFIANALLNAGVWILLWVFSLGFSLGGPMDMVFSLGPAILFWAFWGYFVVHSGIKQYKKAVFNLDRSMRVDDFAAPPSLYGAAPSNREVLDVENW